MFCVCTTSGLRTCWLAALPINSAEDRINPFIDVPALGLPRVLLNAAALMLVFVLAAYLLRALAHWRQRAGG